MRIERMSCDQCNVRIEGEFELGALARLSVEDQVFVAAFVRSHGSIKQMEKLFGISYPTVKNRLNAIVRSIDREFEGTSPNSLVLEKLGRGEISVDEALERLR
ncbi:MAG: DUF2089 domain-containing protein [Candidatus Eisenbacteria bacterium]|uniref:DUF2089 domain-containing protein n=1 Tax=Eiseniibacteriota bacterium TaxID=2212470 RepID=A0A956LZH0_UNCEI|nr:DUF2089 domain-containing protein [Candidatus Eisenbacteria bacterium]